MASDTSFAPAPPRPVREEVPVRSDGVKPHANGGASPEIAALGLARARAGDSLVQRASLANAPNASVRAGLLRQTQQTAGNRVVQRSVLPVQRKLTVNEPGDVFEQEADRVAHAATQSTAREVSSAGASSRPSPDASTASSVATTDSGSPLSSAVRDRVEPLVGANLSRVRVHNDTAAND